MLTIRRQATGRFVLEFGNSHQAPRIDTELFSKERRKE